MPQAAKIKSLKTNIKATRPRLNFLSIQKMKEISIEDYFLKIVCKLNHLPKN
jgi:hypothetical protein